MDFDACRWREHLLETMFIPKDVAAILSLPISCSCMMDRCIWHFMKDGQYSVKSSYHVAMEWINQETAQADF